MQESTASQGSIVRCRQREWVRSLREAERSEESQREAGKSTVYSRRTEPAEEDAAGSGGMESRRRASEGGGCSKEASGEAPGGLMQPYNQVLAGFGSKAALLAALRVS